MSMGTILTKDLRSIGLERKLSGDKAVVSWSKMKLRVGWDLFEAFHGCWGVAVGFFALKFADGKTWRNESGFFPNSFKLFCFILLKVKKGKKFLKEKEKNSVFLFRVKYEVGGVGTGKLKSPKSLGSKRMNE